MSGYVRIDTAKGSMTVRIEPAGSLRMLQNSPAGHLQLAALLLQRAPQKVLLEATGGYKL